MITIHPMPTRFRPLPELELELDIPQLSELAYVLDRIKAGDQLCDGLCVAVMNNTHDSEIAIHFGQAVIFGMNRDVENGASFCTHLYQYLDDEDIAIEELTAIRQDWAKHIARAIYEQIGE